MEENEIVKRLKNERRAINLSVISAIARTILGNSLLKKVRFRATRIFVVVMLMIMIISLGLMPGSFNVILYRD